MPTTSARRLTSLLSRSSGLVLCNLLRCGSGKSRYDSTSVSLSSINDQRGKLRPFRPQLVGDVAQHLAGLGPVGLQESLAQRRRYHALLSFGDIGESIAHPMHAAALPAGAKHPPD